MLIQQKNGNINSYKVNSKTIDFIELHWFETNKKVIERCIENGLITDWFLFAPECLRIGPPLIITNDELKEVCLRINQSIKEALE